MKSFSIDVFGRVQNFPLPLKSALLPLFEAVVNSIHAIEDRQKYDKQFNSGTIKIDIIRDTVELTLEGMKEETPAISAFTIKDNGIGFTKENMDSFLRSDSTYKLARGGKGIGRFSWLKVYKKTNVYSVYEEAGKLYKRNFNFSLQENGIDDSPQIVDDKERIGSIIKLQEALSPYKDNIPKNINEIAIKIIEHCLVYLLSPKCPTIVLNDMFTDKLITLNDLFNEKVLIETKHETFDVLGETFSILHMKADAEHAVGNKMFFCANERLVPPPEELNKYIVDLTKEFYKLNKFYYVGIITGKYLDKNVDMNRLSFNIPEKDEALFIHEITMDKIKYVASEKISQYLKEYLEPMKKQKCEVFRNYIIEKTPQFRHLLKYKAKEIEALPASCKNDKLEDELYKLKREFDRENQKHNQELLNDLKSGNINDQEYKNKFTKQIAVITEVNKSSLAEYIAHRKIIIDLLKQALRIQDNERYVKEEYIHNLIYPMKVTADDIDYKDHNLWLIDEKLAYCDYIASDIPLQPRGDRPDIMLLDNPIAVTDYEGYGQYDTITIFELKRPMRDIRSSEESPVRQLVKYVNKIRNNETQDKYGRKITTSVNTKFYLYAICDVTKKLEEILLNEEDFKRTPDKLGFFIYKTNINAYIEVIPFEKLIGDAEKRNQVLFKKLGIQ